MLLHTHIYPRPQMLRVTESNFPSRSTWRTSHFPSCLAICDLTRSSIFRYAKMSSQTKENITSNIECSEELPLPPSYEMALEALSSLIARQKRGDRSSLGGKYEKWDRMLMYLKILGLEKKIVCLKIIHVAGTKRKGSTCTFSEAILRECGFRTGLFISLHLIDVREIIRLDGLDPSAEKFLMHFWYCWNQLKEWLNA